MNTTIKNSEDYLKSVLKKETGFNTPVNYFTGVENGFSIFLSEEKIPKKSAFKTPDTYFNSLEDVILAKTASTKKKLFILPNKKTYKQRILKFIPIAAAASLAIFIGLHSFVFNTKKNISFDDLADKEIENWIDNNINLINDDYLALTYSSIYFDGSDMIPNSITDNEIENYLNNEDNLSLILEND
jgi:hypothetical protein